MSLTIETDAVPLTADSDGVIRVGATRVTLDTVAAAFDRGATPEEIVQQYPTLELADVYAIIGYYLRRREEVQGYLRRRQQNGQVVRSRNEMQFSPRGVRERLLARRGSIGRDA